MFCMGFKLLVNHLVYVITLTKSQMAKSVFGNSSYNHQLVNNQCDSVILYVCSGFGYC